MSTLHYLRNNNEKKYPWWSLQVINWKYRLNLLPRTFRCYGLCVWKNMACCTSLKKRHSNCNLNQTHIRITMFREQCTARSKRSFDHRSIRGSMLGTCKFGNEKRSSGLRVHRPKATSFSYRNSSTPIPCFRTNMDYWYKSCNHTNSNLCHSPYL